MMTKSDTIEAICRLNPTAEPEFLSAFAPEELARYLQRLSSRPTSGPAFPASHSWEEPPRRRSEPETAAARAPTE